MGLLKVIEWTDSAQTSNVIVQKYTYNIKNDFISKGSKITVRESQAAIFVDKGRIADVFLPGYYTLDTNNVPLLTKLMSWKYGFESPFKSDVYFVNTRQFVNQKWGTQNPIIFKDKEYGLIRIRGFGSYAFRVIDPGDFMKEISSTGASYTTDAIVGWLKSLLVTNISDALGEANLSIGEMAGNLLELGEIVRKVLQPKFKEYGLSLTAFNFENFSLPPELEKALDQNAAAGFRRGNIDVEVTLAQADALREAAKNPGTVGGMMGMGVGLGAGQAMGGAFHSMNQPRQEAMANCPSCGTPNPVTAKFCSKCGKPMGLTCPHCHETVTAGAKFCPSCGKSLNASCPKCGKAVTPGTKFCPDCGEKIA
ncbi:MAG: SPFH domain-containing protein [Bacillales bacterium]|jgi:membrane protease subunit (stomatin/prohibitin family)|nr:SPFH domain-containing protein [Bacillales bacterium]